MELVRYIHLNPVRAKLVNNPEEWEWSSHWEYIGESKRDLIDFKLLKGVFGVGERGFKKYTKFLKDGTDSKYKEGYYPKDKSPFLGTEEFILRASIVRKPYLSNQ